MRFASTQKGIFLEILKPKYFKKYFPVPCLARTLREFEMSTIMRSSPSIVVARRNYKTHHQPFFELALQTVCGKSSLTKSRFFFGVFQRWPPMNCNLFQKKEQIMSYLWTLQSDVFTSMQIVRSDLQSLYDRLQRVEEGESQSQTPSLYPHPAQGA